MLRISCAKAGILLSILFALAGFAGPSYAEEKPAGAEKFVPAGWEIAYKAEGDVTGDKLDDLVLVLMKKDDPEAAGILLVLMRTSDGSFEQIGSNNDLILCEECHGTASDTSVAISNRGVLTVYQLAGSRDTREDLWRFRVDPAARKMRLIGLDAEYRDQLEGDGAKESTNYLTGKRITETYLYDKKKQANVVTKSRTTSVATPKVFLEQVTRKGFLPAGWRIGDN